MGAVEIVWVVKDWATSGTYEFYEINQPDPSIEVNITPEMNDPIEVTMGGPGGRGWYRKVHDCGGFCTC